MTELEWLECRDVARLAVQLEDRRKLRLFACACCRRMRAVMREEKCRHAIDVSEAFADGVVQRPALQEALARFQPSNRELDRETRKRIGKTAYAALACALGLPDDHRLAQAAK